MLKLYRKTTRRRLQITLDGLESTSFQEMDVFLENLSIILNFNQKRPKRSITVKYGRTEDSPGKEE